MFNDSRYKGIFFMLLAALGFSVMGGAAKALKETFSAGQLVFYRNLIGLVFLLPGLLIKPPVQEGANCCDWYSADVWEPPPFIHYFIVSCIFPWVRP
jgi:drug/metabolite transporter (DMT)-like permease